MSKRILFRLHGKHAEAVAQDCKEFIKGCFDLHNKRVRLSIEMFSPEYVSSPYPYDLFIHTASDETEHIAHAAGWSYITGIEQARGLFDTASTTAHDNPRLAEALKSLEIHYTGHPD